MSTFAELVEDGAVRHLGARATSPAWRIARANRIAAERDWPRFECVQPRFSYMIPDRDADFDAQLPDDGRTRRLLRPGGPQRPPLFPDAPGLLRPRRPFDSGGLRPHREPPEDAPGLELAERKGVNGNAVALAWMVGRDQPTVPVVGCSSVEQLDQNLAALDVSFTDEEQRRLDAIERYGFDEGTCARRRIDT